MRLFSVLNGMMNLLTFCFIFFVFVLSCKYLMHKLAFICYIIPLFIMVKINLSYPFLLMCWCPSRVVLMVSMYGVVGKHQWCWALNITLYVVRSGTMSYF